MRIVTLNSELEYLSSQLVKKLPIWDFSSCSFTDSNPRSLELHHDKDGLTDSLEFLNWAFNDMLNYSIELRKSSKLDYSLFYSADLTSIGCAFGSYKDDDDAAADKMVLKCILNEIDAISFTESYLTGNPCSNCSIYNQVCSDTYPGLCDEIKLKSFNGPIQGGAEGPPSVYIISASSFIFWIFYILLAGGVGFAIFVSLKAIRSIQRGFHQWRLVFQFIFGYSIWSNWFFLYSI